MGCSFTQEVALKPDLEIIKYIDPRSRKRFETEAVFTESESASIISMEPYFNNSLQFHITAPNIEARFCGRF